MPITQTNMFSHIIDEANFGVFIVKEDKKILYGNKCFYEILGIPHNNAELSFDDFLHPDDKEELDSIARLLLKSEKGFTHTFRIIKNDGTIVHVETHSAMIYIENKPHVIASLHDVTKRKQTEELNEFLAYHDFLTGLPNQRYFYAKLKKELIKSKAKQQPFTIMLIDLDRFKYVNDTLGHSIGNELLKIVSNRLNSCIDENGVLIRLGGDEFAVVFSNIGNADKIIDYAKRFLSALESPILIDSYELFITASIGISTFPNDGLDYETLIKHADSALYKAKDSGKNTFQFFTSSMNRDVFKTFTLECELRKALELNQFELYYQPQVCSNTLQIIGAEALIRWNHPEWGVITPNNFIPLAEETGIIAEIGKWVKETVCKQIKQWQEAGLKICPVSINLSGDRFLEKDFLVDLERTLKDTNVDPKYLQVEIMETSLLQNEKAVIIILDELKKMGIKVALDDFGTGYSSLSSLKKFKGKIDILKIDKSFIEELSNDTSCNTNVITKMIIELAEHFNMEVIAEGVETKEQLELLKDFNCIGIQGYLFSKPVPAKEFEQLLKKERLEL